MRSPAPRGRKKILPKFWLRSRTSKEETSLFLNRSRTSREALAHIYARRFARARRTAALRLTAGAARFFVQQMLYRLS